MIDRLATAANVVALRGDSYRLKTRDVGRYADQDWPTSRPRWSHVQSSKLALFSVGINTPGKSFLSADRQSGEVQRIQLF